MKKRNILNSPRLSELKKKQYRVLRNKTLLYLFLFLVTLFGIGFLSRWGEVNISNIQVSGNKIIETEKIEGLVREKMAGYDLWLFPKTNFLIYPKGEIQNELIAKFPRLTDISFTSPDFKTLAISLSEREGLYTWCGDELGTEISQLEEGKCHFMDESGYVFDVAPYFSGEVYFKFFGKIERKDDSPLGMYFVPDIFNKVLSFKDNLIDIGLKPASFLIKEDGDAEFYLSSSLPPPNAPKIIFNKDSDFAKLASNLQSALKEEPNLIKKYSSLMYLDLRFGNKVVYKFK